MLNIKNHFFLYSFLILFALSISLIGCTKNNNNIVGNAGSGSTHPLVGNPTEEYYMITFSSGLEYWKGCYKGFEDAGKLFGIKTVYTGSPQYDVNQQVTVLEQVIAKKPAGIAITAMNPDALAAPIKKAVDAGIPVVTFDADSPNSGRYSFLGTGNEYAGTIAARTMAELIGNEGEVALITLPGQFNHELRVEGFKKTLEKEFSNIEIVAIGNGKSDQTEAAKVAAGILQAHPNIKGIFATDSTSGVGVATAVKETNEHQDVKIVSFDTDKGTLDAIKQGIISASIAQGTYNMGYWSMNFLYQLKHDLIQPVDKWKEKNITPLPPNVDAGVNVITIENVDAFYEN